MEPEELGKNGQAIAIRKGGFLIGKGKGKGKREMHYYPVVKHLRNPPKNSGSQYVKQNMYQLERQSPLKKNI